jgi:hypothetical protein
MDTSTTGLIPMLLLPPVTRGLVVSWPRGLVACLLIDALISATALERGLGVQKMCLIDDGHALRRLSSRRWFRLATPRE